MRTARLLIVPLLALVAVSASGAGAKGTFCSTFVKNVSLSNGRPVAKTHDHGVTFYVDKTSKSAFYVCSNKSKSSSEGDDVDGATSFKVQKFAASPTGHCALAFVLMKGHPVYEGNDIAPLMVGEFHLAPHSNSGFSITATNGHAVPTIGKVAFSKNCFSAWVEGTATTGYSINVANTANLKVLNDPNYVPGGVRVTTADDAKNWTLKAQGKDAVLSYTDDGVAMTRVFPFKQ